MRLRNLLMIFAAGATLASAANYDVRLHESTVIAGHEFKPGVYRMQVEANKVITLWDGTRAYIGLVQPVNTPTAAGTILQLGTARWKVVDQPKNEKKHHRDS